MERRHTQIVPNRKFPAVSGSQIRLGGKAGARHILSLRPCSPSFAFHRLYLRLDDTTQAYEGLGDAHIDLGFSVSRMHKPRELSPPRVIYSTLLVSIKMLPANMH